jgi:dimethylamine monooxygenase subunit C
VSSGRDRDHTAFGVSAAHTSAPRDGPLELDPRGTRHLVVAELATDAVRRLLCDAARLERTVDIVVCAGRDDEPVGNSGRPADAQAAEQQIVARLSAASVGLRLYVSGSESFVGRMVRTANRMGLSQAEVRTEVHGSPLRRVRCVHCRATTEDVSTTLARCDGCDRTLVVYHHYSRRHAAWMGFQADAEVAGELPDVPSPCP